MPTRPYPLLETIHSPDELRKLALEAGMVTLVQDGIEKVLAGDLDLAQVLAVCSR